MNFDFCDNYPTINSDSISEFIRQSEDLRRIIYPALAGNRLEAGMPDQVVGSPSGHDRLLTGALPTGQTIPASPNRR